MKHPSKEGEYGKQDGIFIRDVSENEKKSKKGNDSSHHDEGTHLEFKRCLDMLVNVSDS
jgi:hypothetical protein